MEPLESKRLILIPFTIEICEDILKDYDASLDELGIKKSKDWPDEDTLDSIPRIILNIEPVKNPTGFESWMIIKKETKEIIGDLGFKGYNFADNSADLGYAVTVSERRNGYALEATETLVKWAFEQPQLRRLTARCFVENLVSAQLLRKLNFTEIITHNNMIYWEQINKNYQI